MKHIKAPNGKKLRDLRNDALHSEVVCKDNEEKFFVVAESDADPIIEEKDGVTLTQRVEDLEDAVVELAEIITEE